MSMFWFKMVKTWIWIQTRHGRSRAGKRLRSRFTTLFTSPGTCSLSGTSSASWGSSNLQQKAKPNKFCTNNLTTVLFVLVYSLIQYLKLHHLL